MKLKYEMILVDFLHFKDFSKKFDSMITVYCKHYLYFDFINCSSFFGFWDIQKIRDTLGDTGECHKMSQGEEGGQPKCHGIFFLVFWPVLERKSLISEQMLTLNASKV